MEIISGNTENTKINYFGKGSEFALIFFKNLLLTVFTLGIYYPWAKVEILNYQYKNSELDQKKFQFHAKAKEVFIGYIKIYAFVVVFYLLILFVGYSQNKYLAISALGFFYLLFLLLIPFAIHGSVRYRAAKSSWKGIFFKYLGDRSELFWLCLKGIFLTIITLGIYGSWFMVDLRKYVTSHLRFGDLSFDFHGKGKSLFWIHVKFFILFYLTLGIYTFWYYRNLWRFYADNTTVTQNGKTQNLKLNMKPADVFELVFINALLFIFTLGIATPWIIIRTFKYLFRFTEVDGYLNTNTIQHVKYYDFDDATGDSFMDFLDFDLL
jgi:uncharacterized membrane protein YjgN (DUF898 family)